MPQVSDKLRTMFEHDGEACDLLESKGWFHVDWVWHPPAGVSLHDAVADDEAFCAVQYIVDEWDHAVAGVHDHLLASRTAEGA